MRMAVAGVSFLLALAGPAHSQNVISAQSGLIHYLEGEAFLGKDAVKLKAAQYPSIRKEMVFRTGEGRAEVLLTPGAFLRLAENTSIRMKDTDLTNSRVEFLDGSILIEAADVSKSHKDNQVSVELGGATIFLRKAGVYRIDSDPMRLRVYDGEAEVRTHNDMAVVKKGKMLPLEGVLTTEKFDPKLGDAFYRWAGRRSESLATANVWAAKRISDGNVSYGRNGWIYNPYFGMFTFVPMSGTWLSPFRCRYYSPYAVNQLFYRYYPGNGVGGGYQQQTGWNGPTAISHSSSGYSGYRNTSAPMPSNPSTTAAAAPSAPVRGGEGRAGGSSR
ncbi:MAG: FecR domain-containing protein [Bryobacteraceae bacterium]